MKRKIYRALLIFCALINWPLIAQNNVESEFIEEKGEDAYLLFENGKVFLLVTYSYEIPPLVMLNSKDTVFCSTEAIDRQITNGKVLFIYQVARGNDETCAHIVFDKVSVILNSNSAYSTDTLSFIRKQ
ncbi:MAG: hypothetical protein Q4D61_00380 [Cardiobacteriaceae bacterium]|nr:hypothetical protein [Cardiobacteriaceae bacterium]